MSANLDLILPQAMALPESDRAKLAAKLFESLDNDGDTLAPEQWETEWASEILRREVEMERGEKIGRPVEEVVRELREKHS